MAVLTMEVLQDAIDLINEQSEQKRVGVLSSAEYEIEPEIAKNVFRSYGFEELHIIKNRKVMQKIELIKEKEMPVYKVPGGYRFGSSGKV